MSETEDNGNSIHKLREDLREERYQCFHRCRWHMNKKRNWAKHLPMPGEYPITHSDGCSLQKIAGKLHSALLDGKRVAIVMDWDELP